MSPQTQRAYAPLDDTLVSLALPSPDTIAPDTTTPIRHAAKRAIDIIGALCGLVVALPILAICAVGIWLDSPGPFLFRQRRIGWHGKPFVMLKLRTMRAGANAILQADPALYAEYLANQCKLLPGRDPRITRFGRWLRATSIDELPQLWNVLKGDMSLVGPRPLIGPELLTYGPKAATLLSVRPGLTGLWQVSGRSDLSATQRVRLDVAYARMGASPVADLIILARTVPAVLQRRGAQ